MDENEIRKWHNTFKKPNELFEIRILGERTWSGYFYDVENAIAALKPFDNANIYYSINEVKKACSSREQFDCFRQVRGTATSEQDIEHRWWLPIDVDCERPSGVSSTDEEKALAHKKAQDVFRFLRNYGFAEQVICDSSSGYHLFLPIDMGNTQECKQAIKTFLETLANYFTDESVKIDVVLHDANRIIRLPGSYGRKGRSSEARPHRLAKILYAPEITKRLTLKDISDFNERFKISVEPQEKRSWGSQAHGDFNLRDFITSHNINVAKEVPLYGGGTKFILQECPFDSGHHAPDSAIFEMPNGAIAFRCLHNSCAHHDWHELRLKFDPHAYDNKERKQKPQYQYQGRFYAQQQKYEIKSESIELGKKWLTMSDIAKTDITGLENVKTGVNELDKMIVGLYMGEVTLLSGGNSSGKSSWLNTLLLNVVQQGYKCALWSGELRPDVLKAWIQMVAAGKRNLMPSQYVNGKFFVPNTIGERIDAWLDDKFCIYNNEYGTQWEQIFHDMSELLKMGFRFFALDNLFTLNIDLLEGDRNNKQKELILQIKEFAKKNNVHIVLVAHPRKVMTFLRKNDISGTSDLTNAVDNVFIMHRVNQDFIKAASEFYGNGLVSQYQIYGNVIEVSKNRMHGVVDFMAGLHYEMESRRFKNTEIDDVHYGWENEKQQVTPIQETLNDDFFTQSNEAPF